MMRAKAVYRALLHCYPAAFRHEYGNQMVLVFAEQLGEARRTGGRLQAAVVWIEAAEDRVETPYAVISYDYWQRRFGGSPDVLGKAFTLHSAVLNIIGVTPRGFIGETSGQQPDLWPTFLIRTVTKTAPVMAAVRKAIQRVDATLPLLSAKSIEEQIAPLMAHDHTTAQLAIVFGCVALTLAAAGLYGVLSYGVARRTGEIAVRIALGAQPGRVIAMVLSETMGLVIAGLAIGAGLSFA